MSGNKNKKYAAACLGGGMLLAALAMTQNFENAEVFAADKTQQESELSLAIAGGAQTEADAASDTVEETKEGTALTLADETAESDGAENEAAAEVQAEAVTEAQTEAQTEAVTEAQTEAQTEATAQEAPVSYDTLATTSTGEDGIIALDVSGIVENCMPSIVAISNKTVQEVQSYLYGSQSIEIESAGSGIIIAQNDTELLIATNNHVVEDSKDMTVCFSVNAENEEDLVVPAVTKGTDSATDLAVIAVKLSDIPEEIMSQLKIATLGSSGSLKVGETAISIGNALGTGQTVTSGIVSALEREITTEVGTFTEIQTDAAINLGCSGGALLNKRGEVIGINSAKATTDYAESMGYAIPIDTAIPVLTSLINRETRAVQENHGYMGITVVPVSEEAKQMYSMPAGAYVYEVPEGSAAEAAGLKKGDIITKFDGITITTSDGLIETLGYYAPGETVTIEVSTAEGGAYISKEMEITLQKGTSDTASDSSSDNGRQPDGSADGSQQPDDSQNEDGEAVPDGGSYYGGMDGSEEDMYNQFYDYFFNGGGDGYYGEDGGNGIETIPYGQNDSNQGL
ncbi:MAG: trypsin-like peptidase domain-containing protein [Lachnospiraceae bacterium]|nr:trypsin-like peptidase domain-containing protein [Lachnospiraceae bacterium]